jgi:chromosome segregation ATPase
MNIPSIEVKSEPQRLEVWKKFSLIFQTGFSEIKRKGTITRLHFEIKSLEKEKDRYVHALGVRAWEAHVEHPDLAGIVVHLKELQIEMNRLKTQFGEHDTQIQDIESSKTSLTTQFNQTLDQLEQRIVPHRKRIDTINAEKEDNKVQMEDLRAKQDALSQQVRNHQQTIQELDLGEDPAKAQKIELEQECIRKTHVDKSEIDCKIPFLFSRMEKLKIALANEKAEIEKLEEEKADSKRDYEQRIKDYNHEIHQLEEKKKQAYRQMEHFRREMEPYLYNLGSKVEQLRLQEAAFRENFQELDRLNAEMAKRQKQITEAESLSRAMDRAAWLQFLVFSGCVVLLFLSMTFFLLH